MKRRLPSFRFSNRNLPFQSSNRGPPIYLLPSTSYYRGTSAWGLVTATASNSWVSHPQTEHSPSLPTRYCISLKLLISSGSLYNFRRRDDSTSLNTVMNSPARYCRFSIGESITHQPDSTITFSCIICTDKLPQEWGSSHKEYHSPVPEDPTL